MQDKRQRQRAGGGGEVWGKSNKKRREEARKEAGAAFQSAFLSSERSARWIGINCFMFSNEKKNKKRSERVGKKKKLQEEQAEHQPKPLRAFLHPACAAESNDRLRLLAKMNTNKKFMDEYIFF